MKCNDHQTAPIPTPDGYSLGAAAPVADAPVATAHVMTASSAAAMLLPQLLIPWLMPTGHDVAAPPAAVAA